MCDKYGDTSLKLTASLQCDRMGVTRQANVPKNSRGTLKNKNDLIKFLGEAIQTEQWPDNKVVCVTTSDNVAARE